MTAKDIVNAEKWYDPKATERNGSPKLAALVTQTADGTYAIYPDWQIKTTQPFQYPIKGCSKEEVEQFAADNGLVHLEDLTKAETPVKDSEAWLDRG